ncbi:hypothetical protein HX744_14530 [Pseudonocardia sp. ICBG1122]|nr:hypothetical protein [Pseudonocardia pini]
MNRAERRAAARRNKPLRAPGLVAEIELSPEAWEAIAGEAEELLDVAETGGISAAEEWLRARGLSYEVIRRG